MLSEQSVQTAAGKKLKSAGALLVAGLLSVSLVGCSKAIKYGDAAEVETTTTGFGSTDLQQIAAKMVDSVLTFPPVVEITAKRRPVMFVDTIKNKTTEHIDTESITDTISTKLLRSGKFRFVDMTKVAAVKQQLDYQSDSGMVNQNAAMKMGQQVGAEYMLYGNLSSIVKRNSSRKDVYYKFTLKLMHLQSGIVEWSDEKEIRKSKEKSLFGL
ncbi:MAG: penicillin-binding protein activator LpoB [Gammaproteobacteria bacterium]|nr:penicillin-binding protein activator LpoB [Gammaproteobacteria bacterium]MCF6258688.1 penicillin-binding protein activator LpoB [Gammaproteobacteria bacterium]